MSLPTTSQTQLRICVLLSDSNIQTQLLAVNQAGSVVKRTSTVRSYNTPENCILRLDECLRELGSESESINEVVYGLQPDWVAGNAIAASKTHVLQKITTELSLQAVGFVVTTEAVLEQELVQHPHFSGTVCVVSATQLFLLLSVQGSVIGVEQVGRSGSVATDMIEAIARLAGHLEPGSRFPDQILLVSLDLPDAQLQAFEQDLLQIDWSTVDALGKVPILRSIPQEQYMAIVGVGAGRATILAEAETAPAQTGSTVDVADVGFAEVPLASASIEATESSDNKNVSQPIATSFGIPISADKLLTKPTSKKAQELLAELEAAPLPKKKRFTHKHGIMVGIGGGILALALGYVLVGFLYASAAISITPKLETVSESLEITLDPSVSQTDPVERKLAAKIITKEVTGTDDILTTGVEIVGEKATGTVTIFNKVTAEKVLPKGTLLKAGTLEFTLNEETTLVAATEDKKGIEFSQTDAAVTAVAIGAEGNIAKEAALTVGDFATSTYEAEAKDAFTGGASREVRVVAEADQKALLDDLTTTLVKQATEELESETPDGTYVIPPTGYKVMNTEYDAEPKTEAEKLSLTLTVQIQSLSYTATDLRPIAQAVLADKVPEGYKLANSDPQILSDLVDTPIASGAAKNIKLAAQVSSQAEPEFDTAKLIENIAGKSLLEAQRSLTEDKRIKQSSVSVQPTLFAPIIRSVPSDPKRVTLTIVEQ